MRSSVNMERDGVAAAERTGGSDDRLALSVGESARALGVGVRTLWRLVATRRLHVACYGGRVIVPVDALRNFIAAGGAA